MSSDDLVRAARDGRVDDVVALLSSGVDANTPNSLGWLALVRAASNGNIQCVKVGSAFQNDPPLLYHNVVWKALLNAKAAVNGTENKSGLTALMRSACAVGEVGLECMKVSV